MTRSGTALVALALVATGGCAVSEPCAAMCASARPAYEACMEQWGLEYGDGVGLYESADDYDGWCATYNRQRALLARTADDRAAAEADLDAHCDEQRATLDAGDCGAYYSVFSDD